MACRRIQRDDLALGVAHGKVEPTLVVGCHVPLVLPPVLPVDVAVILELARLRVVGGHPAIGIGDRPDDAVVIFGHPHRHLRDGLAVEGELALHRVELGEVAAKVSVELVGAGEDRSEGTVASGGEGDGKLLALSRLRVDHQESVSPAVVVEPEEDNVAPLSIHGGDDSPVVTDRSGDPVMEEAVAHLLGTRKCAPGGLEDEWNPRQRQAACQFAGHMLAPLRSGLPVRRRCSGWSR